MLARGTHGQRVLTGGNHVDTHRYEQGKIWEDRGGMISLIGASEEKREEKEEEEEEEPRR